MSESTAENPNVRQLSNIKVTKDGNIKSLTPDVEGGEVNKGYTDIKSKSINMCSENNSSPERTQNTSSEMVKHTSDDPSAPTYPPRSPTSDIVPTELPPCHILPAISKAYLAEDSNMCQVDGNAEIPKNIEITKSIITDQEKDIMVLFDGSNQMSKNVSHSSSSSSVSSNDSRASSSVRESMSDTVSIHSSNSSGYGSESFDNNYDPDCKASAEILSYKSYNSNKLYRSDHSYCSTYIENNITYFDSLSLQNYINASYKKESKNFSKNFVNYEPIQEGLLQPMSDVYKYHDGKLIPIVKSPHSNIYSNRNITSESQQSFHCANESNLLHGSKGVVAIQTLLQNIDLTKK